MNKKAIGIFDSGLGGLCAVREALKILPDEDIVYFGDTGRVPYGGRSYETIKKYARQDMNFLISKNIKIILIACGTVASVAIDYLKEIFPGMPIIGVVETACEKAVGIAKETQNKNIGVIGTDATISKGMYKKYISELDLNCEVYSKACPLFVPLVENGHINKDDIITKSAAELYLSEFKNLNLSSLILGCTHYPMIKNIIDKVINDKNGKTELIDVGLEAAYKLKQELTKKNLLNNSGEKGGLDIYISDEGLNFKNIASGFLGFDINSGVNKIDIENY
ncbi:MAG: glutamate racemase [Oscillospiraceae bacterium]|nr:glutamate racemase [Oscillospiraceae bacterium]